MGLKGGNRLPLVLSYRTLIRYKWNDRSIDTDQQEDSRDRLYGNDDVSLALNVCIRFELTAEQPCMQGKTS